MKKCSECDYKEELCNYEFECPYINKSDKKTIEISERTLDTIKLTMKLMLGLVKGETDGAEKARIDIRSALDELESIL